MYKPKPQFASCLLRSVDVRRPQGGNVGGMRKAQFTGAIPIMIGQSPPSPGNIFLASHWISQK